MDGHHDWPAGAIAVVDDDPATAALLARVLTSRGCVVSTPSLAELAAGRVGDHPLDLIVVSLDGAGTPGTGVVAALKQSQPSTLVAALAEAPSAETAIQAFREGAWDVLIKPVTAERALALAERALTIQAKGRERRRIAEQLARERARVEELQRRLGDDDPFRKLLGVSPIVRNLVETLREVARSESTVLITGESGTGKGVVARAIHDASDRAKGPFVEANCVVYSEGVLHSELFGHERGAFTGASRQKKGRFELAQGGTIFLDEIGEITPATQLLLLRVLQDRSFERVGGEDTLRTDVRLIAATNADLEAALRAGTFRSDLYYRLNVIPVHLPPLRAHLEDVPVLAASFLRRFSERGGREIEGFAPSAVERLTSYDWPGNVRELENLVERLVVLARSSVIDVADLPEHLRGGRATTVGGWGTLRTMEAERIVETLRQCGGNKKLAAAKLGIHRATLYAKMRRYGIPGVEARSASIERELVGSRRD